MSNPRTVRPSRRQRRLVDEQFWPVTLSVSALSAVVMGTFTAYLTTDAELWYANSWSWCFITLGLTAVVIVALRLQSRSVRPGVQVSVILCLLLHAVLLVVSIETNIFGQFWQELLSATKPVERKLLIEPSYEVFQSEEDRQAQLDEWQQPVQSSAQDSTTTIDRAASPSLSSEPAAQEAPVQPPEITPNLLERNQVEQTVPRLSEQWTRLSRQSAPQVQPTVPEVTAPKTDQRATADLEQPTPLIRRQLPQLSSALDHSLEVPPATNIESLRRSTRAEQTPDLASGGPSLSRSAQIRRGPQAATVEAPGAAREQPRATLEARDLNLRRATNVAGPRPAQPGEGLAASRITQSLPPGAAAGGGQPQIALSNNPSDFRLSRRRSAAGPETQARVDWEGLASSNNGTSPTPSESLQPSSRTSGRRSSTAVRPERGDIAAAGSETGSRLATTGMGVRASPTTADSPAATPGERGRARRRSLASLQPDTAVAVDNLGNIESPSSTLGGGGEPSLADAGANRLKRSTTLAVELPAVEGPGGLQSGIQLDPGVRSQRASRESDQVQPQINRFRRRTFSGPPAPQTNAVVAAEPFRQRSDRLRNQPRASDALGRRTERAIELGLEFLARNQRSDGRWTLRSVDPAVVLSSDTAATGLALLAFQGAGYSHLEHQYADVVERGIEFLKREQRPNGDLFRPQDDGSNKAVWLYSHGIAALALSEAYGMTLDPELRDAAQRAIDFVDLAQDKTNGGWRYTPGLSSDTSVSGWMLMALKSAELAQLQVDPESLQLARRWFDLAQDSAEKPHLYRYNPFAPDTDSQRHGRVSSKTMTSVGLLMRLYDGWRREDPAMQQGAAYLRENLPSHGVPGASLRDTYYWYYGTQVMFHMGANDWDAWRGALLPLILDNQIEEGPLAGSWHAGGRTPDRWAVHAGRLYVTTLNLLSLEVQYRHLPLYEETGR